VPSQKSVYEHLAPQLTLEAAILQAGGFAEHGLPPAPVKTLDYLRLTGRHPPGERLSIAATPEFVQGALDMLHKLIASYQKLEQPYVSHIRPKNQNFVSAYDHLARLAEWRSTLDEGGGDEQD